VNVNRPNRRFLILAVSFGLIIFIILAQASYYQVFGGRRALAERPIVKEPAPRGMVVDSHGVPLIVNRHFFRVAATPNLIMGDIARDEVAKQLESLLGLPYANTFSTLQGRQEYPFAILADAISLEEANLLNETKQRLATEQGMFPLQHVYVTPMTRRSYPQGEALAHLTGFVSVEYGGVSGIEEYYDEFLPADGIGLLEEDTAALDALPADVRRFLPSAPGKDLVLTVDRTIQWIIREELRRGLEEFKAVSGSVIVLDPRTGALLGMVNLPDFDPNRYEQAPVEFFRNPAVSAQYEPGSVFKIVTMAAALDSGMIEPTTIFTDTGSYTIGERVVFNSDRNAYGEVTAAEALARSLNVITAEISDTMGPEQFYRYLRQFGLGEATKIDLSGEINGSIKTPAVPQWSRSDLGTNSFGQGLAVTPIQMANATAVIANGGKMMQPYVVAARVADERVQFTKPAAVRQVISPEAANELTEMMIQVVETSSVKAGVPGYRIAGKSGTAQIPLEDGSGYEKSETIVSFVGFAPAENPRFVLLVKMDRPDPTINQWASHTAAPVFSRIAQRLLDYMNIPPDTALSSGEAATGE
jgi:cell division protein FtsI/penicillin-binding protein 2